MRSSRFCEGNEKQKKSASFFCLCVCAERNEGARKVVEYEIYESRQNRCPPGLVLHPRARSVTCLSPSLSPYHLLLPLPHIISSPSPSRLFPSSLLLSLPFPCLPFFFLPLPLPCFPFRFLLFPSLLPPSSLPPRPPSPSPSSHSPTTSPTRVGCLGYRLSSGLQVSDRC